MALDERALFSDKSETRQGRYACPKCKRTNDYSIRWVRRTKKDRLPPGADDGDRAKFAKLRDYLLRLDDDVTCKTCGKKFEIPSQQSMNRGRRPRPSLQRRTSRHCPTGSRVSRAAGSRPTIALIDSQSSEASPQTAE
jgi:hypothetical protein